MVWSRMIASMIVIFALVPMDASAKDSAEQGRIRFLAEQKLESVYETEFAQDPRMDFPDFFEPLRVPPLNDHGHLAWTDRDVFLATDAGSSSRRLALGDAASGEPQSAEAGGPDLDAIGEAMANPLSYLWLMFMQNDTIWNDGKILDRRNLDAKPQNIFLLNPVFSVQLTENWKTIVRPVIPIVSFNTLDNVNTPRQDSSGVIVDYPMQIRSRSVEQADDRYVQM